MVFRLVPSVYVLAVPFFVRSRSSFWPTQLQANFPQIYGFAFLFVGLAAIPNGISRTWLQNVGIGLYSFASSSGSIFFALNFGDEGMQQFFQELRQLSDFLFQVERL